MLTSDPLGHDIIQNKNTPLTVLLPVLSLSLIQLSLSLFDFFYYTMSTKSATTTTNTSAGGGSKHKTSHHHKTVTVKKENGAPIAVTKPSTTPPPASAAAIEMVRAIVLEELCNPSNEAVRNVMTACVRQVLREDNADLREVIDNQVSRSVTGISVREKRILLDEINQLIERQRPSSSASK